MTRKQIETAPERATATSPSHGKCGLYKCAGPSCPGLSYRASDMPHPASCAVEPAVDTEAAAVPCVCEPGSPCTYHGASESETEDSHAVRCTLLRFMRDWIADYRRADKNGDDSELLRVSEHLCVAADTLRRLAEEHGPTLGRKVGA